MAVIKLVDFVNAIIGSTIWSNTTYSSSKQEGSGNWESSKAIFSFISL